MDIAEGDAEAQLTMRHILTRAKDRMVQDAYEGATLGRYNERITTLRLGRMGETVAQQIEHTGAMTVTWQGISAEDAARYSQ